MFSIGFLNTITVIKTKTCQCEWAGLRRKAFQKQLFGRFEYDAIFLHDLAEVMTECCPRAQTGSTV